MGDRFIRARCPYCNDVSAVVDQVADIRRTGLSDWWAQHISLHIEGPTIERCDGIDG